MNRFSLIVLLASTFESVNIGCNEGLEVQKNQLEQDGPLQAKYEAVGGKFVYMHKCIYHHPSSEYG